MKRIILGVVFLASAAFVHADVSPTFTPTVTETDVDSPTFTATPSFTDEDTATVTPTATQTGTNPETFTFTATPTFTATFTWTFTVSRTATFTLTLTPSFSKTITATMTAANLATITMTATNTPVTTATPEAAKSVYDNFSASFYPNPVVTGEKLYMLYNLNKAALVTVNIVTIDNRAVMNLEQNLSGKGKFSVDTSSFAPGVYFYTVKTKYADSESKSGVKKLLVTGR
jgi:hypothetical protein